MEETNGALASQTQMMTVLMHNILEHNHRQEHALPGVPVQRPAIEVHPPSDGSVVSQRSSNLGHSSHKMPHSEFLPSEATAFDLTLSSCGLNCTCTCHKRTRFRSPRFLNTIIGSLFLGYNASPLFGQKCNKEHCRSPATDIRYTYKFPHWFVDRVVILKMSNNLPKGPELCIRLARMRPHNAQIFIATGMKRGSEEVAVRHVERLLLAGEASVLDVDPDGATALQVKNVSFKML